MFVRTKILANKQKTNDRRVLTCNKVLIKQYIHRIFFSSVVLLSHGYACAEQTSVVIGDSVAADSIVTDSVKNVRVADEHEGFYSQATGVDTLAVDSAVHMMTAMPVDTVGFADGRALEKKRWIPDPKKSMWLAIAFPGGGQIYNRKYWKLPIIYGGFMGCFYALNWNNTMYRDYSQAYIDIMDSDENTKSFMNFLPAGYNVEQNMSRLQDLFKRKKNFYRRYRDMSLFCMIGVYLISIVDAYVDAEMSSFDISKDLSIKLSPAVINDRLNARTMPSLNGSSYGINCSLNF